MKCPVCKFHRVVNLGDANFCHGCYTYHASDRRTLVAYDAEYVAQRYDRYPTTEAMTALRLDVMESVIHLAETMPRREDLKRGRLLDIGYGNGSFIRGALKRGWDAFGNDVNPTDYEKVRKVDLPRGGVMPYRAITFFDSLEHFEEFDGVRGIADFTDWIFITMPLPPWYFLSSVWKHWRPGEHHFYFRDPRSFEALFSSERRDARIVYTERPEDVIRGALPDGLPNIQTVALRCEYVRD
jgi:SAM-dependent methyltransferase